MNIVITGGGTGGHLYPGLEIAKYYRDLGHNVYYVASENGVDRDIIRNEINLEGIDINFWNLRGLQRKLNLQNMLENIKTVFKLIFLLKRSKKFIKENEIEMVIGVGGYISYPLIRVASKNKNVYTMIHEQNSYPGLVNMKLSSMVDKVGIVYEEARNYFKVDEDKIENVSNPRVDNCINYINKKFYEETGFKKEKKNVLFLGGSLGAETINQLFNNFVLEEGYQSILISGLKNNENTISKEELGGNIILQSTNEILKYIATADIVVSRAGATTLLELIYMEKKSIIIPSPNVVANHQYLNAMEFDKEKLIYTLEEKMLSYNEFINKVNSLYEDTNIEKNLMNFEKISSLSKFKKILNDK